MDNRYDRPNGVASDVIKQISGHDQDSKYSGEYAARPATLTAGPCNCDVRTPQQAENPDRGKSKRAMQAQPPRSQRVLHRAEIALFAKEVVKQQPETAGKPDPDADDVKLPTPGTTESDRLMNSAAH